MTRLGKASSNAKEKWSRAIVGRYADHARSGSDHLRPDFQRLLNDARAGKFDLVLAESLDRLSRDLEHTAAFFKQLSFSGIRLVTLAEGDITDLHVGLKGTMAQLYLKDLAQKTWRGLEGRIRDGSSAGGLCYGYTVVREVDSRGNPVRGRRGVDQSEAQSCGESSKCLPPLNRRGQSPFG